MEHRSNDDLKGPSANRRFFRSERYFNLNGEWFFATREGDQGPFRTREAAADGLVRYMSERASLDRFQASREGDRVQLFDNVTPTHKLEIVPIEGKALV